ncbi:MAG: alpha/beta fold hydrolase [Bdellovibrionales bacterium]|nr:alpha/beta fold hydrolase [Bdellovibrionales bacterium]
MALQPISVLFVRILIILSLQAFVALSSWAGHPPKDGITVQINDCVYLLERSIQTNTLRETLKAASVKLQAARTEQPDPSFVDIEAERKIEWSGVSGLKVFDHFLPQESGIKFLQTSSVNQESPWVAMRLSPETGGFLNVSYPWRGKNLKTTVYFNKPIPTHPEQTSSQYLIGGNHEYVILDMHGGGTPSAESGNGSSKGSFYVKRGIPFISIDLPGHGKGTREPMNGLDDILDNYLAILDQIVHPDVKVFLTGHSWGGEIALYAHQISKDPRLHRIQGFVPQSPPGDLSLGGSAEDKVRLEEALEHRLLHDPVLTERIAEGDYEFLSNIVRSGKVNPVASWYTQATQMEYSFAINPSGHRHLKPALVLMGKSDGLVYVGREEAFERYMSKMVESGRFVVMGKGQTFKGSDIDTGHQIFDKEIELGKLLEELNINYEDLGPNFDSIDAKVYEANMRALLFMGEVAGKHFGRVNYEGDQGTYSLLYKMFLLYSNNFAFREYIDQAVEYIRRPLENATTLQYRRKVLARAVDSAKKLMDEKDNKLPRIVQERMKDYDRKYDVVGGKEVAKRELALTFSPERKKVLEEFLVAIEKAEEDFRKTFRPQEYLDKINELKLSVSHKLKEFRSRKEKKAAGQVVPQSWFDEDLFAQAQRLFDIDEANKQIAALSKRNSRDPFPEYEETVAGILSEVGFASVEALSAEASQPVKPIDGLPGHDQTERKKILENTFQLIKNLEKLKRSLYSEANAEYVKSHVTFPSGIQSVSQAKWELRADHSVARKTQLAEYLENYDSEAQRIKNELSEDFDRRIDELEYPDGIHGYDVAEAALNKADQQLADHYVPQNNNRVHYEGMVKAITAVQEKSDVVNRELERVNLQLDGLKDKRDEMLRTVQQVYEQVVKDPFSEKLPEKLIQAAQKAEEALLIWIDKNKALSDRQSNHLLEAHKQGRTSGWAMAHPPEDIHQYYEAYSEARKAYYVALEEVNSTWLNLAISGQFKDSEIPKAKKVQSLLIRLLGENYLSDRTLGENSIEGKLQRLEEQQDHLLRLKAVTMRELNEKKMVYLQRLKEDPHAEGYYEIVKVPMKDLLDQGFDDFWFQVNQGPNSKAYRQALTSVMSNWESKTMWVDVLREGDRAHPDWYPVKSFMK